MPNAIRTPTRREVEERWDDRAEEHRGARRDRERAPGVGEQHGLRVHRRTAVRDQRPGPEQAVRGEHLERPPAEARERVREIALVLADARVDARRATRAPPRRRACPRPCRRGQRSRPRPGAARRRSGDPRTPPTRAPPGCLRPPARRRRSPRAGRSRRPPRPPRAPRAPTRAPRAGDRTRRSRPRAARRAPRPARAPRRAPAWRGARSGAGSRRAGRRSSGAAVRGGRRAAATRRGRGGRARRSSRHRRGGRRRLRPSRPAAPRPGGPAGLPRRRGVPPPRRSHPRPTGERSRSV